MVKQYALIFEDEIILKIFLEKNICLAEGSVCNWIKEWSITFTCNKTTHCKACTFKYDEKFLMKYLFQHFVRNLAVFSHGRSSFIQHTHHFIRVTILEILQIIAIFSMGALNADVLKRNYTATILI